MVLAAFLGTWQPSTHSRGLSCPHLRRVGALRSRGGDWFVCMLSYLSLQHPSGCSGSSVPEFRTVDSDVLSLMALVEGLTFGAFCSAIFYDVTSPLGYLGLTTFGGNCSQFFFSFHRCWNGGGGGDMVVLRGTETTLLWEVPHRISLAPFTKMMCSFTVTLHFQDDDNVDAQNHFYFCRTKSWFQLF